MEFKNDRNSGIKKPEKSSFDYYESQGMNSFQVPAKEYKPKY